MDFVLCVPEAAVQRVHVSDHPLPTLTYRHGSHLPVEIVILALITMEIIVRFLVWPSKLRYFLDFLNWVDLVSTIITWTGICVRADAEVYITYVLVFASLRLFRVFRIWRSYNPYRALVMALIYSIKDFFLTIVIFLVLEAIFGFWIFAVEIQYDVHQTYLDNAFSGMYWAVITMTTVGYGDMLPMTWVGRCVATYCAWAGLLMITLPVGIFSRNYSLALQHLEAARGRRMPRLGESVAFSTSELQTADSEAHQRLRDNSTVQIEY